MRQHCGWRMALGALTALPPSDGCLRARKGPTSPQMLMDKTVDTVGTGSGGRETWV